MAQHSYPRVFCVGLPGVFGGLASPAVPIPMRPRVISYNFFSTCRQRNLQNLFGKEDVVIPMHYVQGRVVEIGSVKRNEEELKME